MKYEGPFQDAARDYLEKIKGYTKKPVPRYINQGMNKNYCVPDGCFEDNNKHIHLLDAKDDRDTVRELQTGVGQWIYNQQQYDYSWGAVAKKHIQQVYALCKKSGIGLFSVDEQMNVEEILPAKFVKRTKKKPRPKTLAYARDLTCDLVGECLEMVDKINPRNKNIFVKKFNSQLHKQYSTMRNVDNNREKNNWKIPLNKLGLLDEDGCLIDKGKSLLKTYRKDLEDEKNEKQKTNRPKSS